MTTMRSPLVSVITVVYNNKEGIQKTLASVASQTYANIEYIVIDGGSTDGTGEIISSFRDKISIYISEPDQGIYDAMNKGLRLAKGDLIGIINSGDHYESDAIENIVRLYHENPQAAIFHGVLRVFDESGYFKSIIGNHSSLLVKGMIEHPTCFVKREVYRNYGLFNLAYESSADYEFMLRVKKMKVDFVFVEKILANYYTGGISFQTKALLETLKIKEHYGLISSYRRVIITNIIRLRAKLKI